MQPAELIGELYSAFVAKDEARLRGPIAPDVEWRQCAGFPGGKNRRGVDDMLNGILGTNLSLWHGFRAKTTEFLPSSGTVIVIGAYSGTHVGTGKSMRAAFTHIYPAVALDCAESTGRGPKGLELWTIDRVTERHQW